MQNKTAYFEGVLRVRTGKEAEFERWREKYHQAVSSFEGYIPVPEESRKLADSRWISRLKFGDAELLQRWLSSKTRTQLLNEAEPLIVGGVVSRLSVGEDPGVGVTEIIFSKVRPGSETAFRDWQAEINRCQSQFPGYLGAALQPPVAGQEHWTTLLRFDRAENLETWLASEARKRLLQKERGLVESRRQHRLSSAFPGWIPTPPSNHESPPEWKTLLLVLLGLFPIVMLQFRFLNPYLVNLPLAVGTFISCLSGATLIAYVTMPICLRVFAWWLYPQGGSSIRTSLLGSLAVACLYALEIALLSVY